MSAEPMIRELFRTLETTLHERLALIEQILVTVEKPKVPLYDNEFVKRIERLERQVVHQDTSYLENRITALEEQLAATNAEVEELRARPITQLASMILPEEEDCEVLEEEAEAEEAEPEEVEPEEEGLELEELLYKGITYYKDSDNNVYGTDEEGTVIPEPIARWNGVKLVRLT
jgi:TolA-binding protein